MVLKYLLFDTKQNINLRGGSILPTNIKKIPTLSIAHCMSDEISSLEWVWKARSFACIQQEKKSDSHFFCAFQRLKSQSTKYRTDKTYPTKTAEKQDNIKKNRYKDIVPCKLRSRQICFFHTSA